MGRLVRRPGGPPRQLLKLGQSTYPVNGEWVGMEGREGSEEQSYKDEERELWNGTGKGPRGP